MPGDEGADFFGGIADGVRIILEDKAVDPEEDVFLASGEDGSLERGVGLGRFEEVGSELIVGGDFLGEHSSGFHRTLM